MEQDGRKLFLVYLTRLQIVVVRSMVDNHANTPALKALPGRLKDKTETGGVTFYELLK